MPIAEAMRISGIEIPRLEAGLRGDITLNLDLLSRLIIGRPLDVDRAIEAEQRTRRA